MKQTITLSTPGCQPTSQFSLHIAYNVKHLVMRIKNFFAGQTFFMQDEKRNSPKLLI
mgnify:CR=1 FL=1